MDSVLQRDESRDRERGCDKLEKMRARETERTENGQDRGRGKENVKERDRKLA